jgi:hypothetical protein
MTVDGLSYTKRLELIDQRLIAHGVELIMRKRYWRLIEQLAEHSRSNCTVGATDDARHLVVVFENDENERKIVFMLPRLTSIAVVTFADLENTRVSPTIVQRAFKWLYHKKRRRKKDGVRNKLES